MRAGARRRRRARRPRSSRATAWPARCYARRPPARAAIACVLRRGGERALRRGAHARCAASGRRRRTRMQALRDDPTCADEEQAARVDPEAPGPDAWRCASIPTPTSPRPTSRAARGRASRSCASRASTVRSRWRRPSLAPASSRRRAHDRHPLGPHRGSTAFRGLAACGGFSYGDVLGAGEGWAKSILVQRARARRVRGVLRAPRHVHARRVQRLPDAVEPARAHPGRRALAALRAQPQRAVRGAPGAGRRSRRARRSARAAWPARALPIAVAHGEGRAEFARPTARAALERERPRRRALRRRPRPRHRALSRRTPTARRAASPRSRTPDGRVDDPDAAPRARVPQRAAVVAPARVERTGSRPWMRIFRQRARLRGLSSSSRSAERVGAPRLGRLPAGLTRLLPGGKPDRVRLRAGLRAPLDQALAPLLRRRRASAAGTCVPDRTSRRPSRRRRRCRSRRRSPGRCRPSGSRARTTCRATAGPCSIPVAAHLRVSSTPTSLAVAPSPPRSMHGLSPLGGPALQPQHLVDGDDRVGHLLGEIGGQLRGGRAGRGRQPQQGQNHGRGHGGILVQQPGFRLFSALSARAPPRRARFPETVAPDLKFTDQPPMGGLMKLAWAVSLGIGILALVWTPLDGRGADHTRPASARPTVGVAGRRARAAQDQVSARAAAGRRRPVRRARRARPDAVLRSAPVARQLDLVRQLPQPRASPGATACRAAWATA